MYASKAEFFAPLSPDAGDDSLLRLRCDSQSLAYYGDMSRFIAARLLQFETVSLLDVGPRTGAGLALLRLLHHPQAFTRLKFDPVVGIDVDPAFEAIARREFPDIGSRTGDIFQIEAKSFDVVTCSHTIEHVEDVEGFVRQLENIARRAVVLASPFEGRQPKGGSPLQYIDSARLKAMGYVDHEVYDSFHHHSGQCCLAFKAVTG